MRGAGTLFFHCNVVSDAIRAERGISTDSPAGRRKVVGLCRALRRNGDRATIVSTARGGGTRSGRWFRGRVERLGGVPVIYGPVWDVPVVAQLVSTIWLVLCAIRLERRHRGSVHLFYNQMSTYLPAMTVLRLRGARVSVDIEDGPITDRRPAYSRRFSTVSPATFARFVSNGALLATSALAHGTPIRPVLSYFGAVRERAGGRDKRFDAGPLVAIFAGYLNDDTGLGILAAAIAMMRDANDPAFDALVIEVSGMGPGLDVLRQFEGGARPAVRVLGRLDDAHYAALLARAHIGLSLKPVNGDIAESTFPSKTVEYAEHGLALIATDISDVRSLFGDAALYIESNRAEELVAHLRAAVADRPAIAGVAAAGRRLIDDRLSDAAAGRMLSRFLFGNAGA